MVSFSLRQRISSLLLQDPTPVSFHLSQFDQREKPKTALTAARGFCKLRKSRSKVRFRSETKPERRRSAPGPENQIPIPIEHAHQSRRQLRL